MPGRCQLLTLSWRAQQDPGAAFNLRNSRPTQRAFVDAVTGGKMVSRRCGLAAEQIVAAAMGVVMRHDAIVKTARFVHQRIDVLGQQKT